MRLDAESRRISLSTLLHALARAYAGFPSQPPSLAGPSIAIMCQPCLSPRRFTHSPAVCSGGSGGGLLNNLRRLLWVPIDQRAYRRVSVDVFGHLLDLDLDYHLHRKTGARQGTACVLAGLGHRCVAGHRL